MSKPRSTLTHPVTDAAISIASDLMPKIDNKILFTTSTEANGGNTKHLIMNHQTYTVLGSTRSETIGRELGQKGSYLD